MGRNLARLLLTAVLLCFAASPAFSQVTITVADTIHAPDGSLPTGKIVISAPTTFTAADGSVVFQGVVAEVAVTTGAFTVDLIPNAGSSPSGSYYTAKYQLSGVPVSTEIWIVPSSPDPSLLSDVRTTTVPTPSLSILPSQITAPSGCISGQVFAWNGSSWTCQTVSGTGTVTDFIASAGSWPSWLVPNVTNSTTTPTLSVSASAIPNSALASASITINSQTCTLGSSCTVSSSLTWANSEGPAGTLNGVNETFTLNHPPSAGTLRLILNGLTLREGAGFDYTLSGDTITMAYAPKSGDNFIAWYQY